MKIVLLAALLVISGCGSMGGIVDKATEPGKDTRCFTGMGFEFCYFRERTVDDRQSDADRD